jgi:hypothetical protein
MKHFVLFILLISAHWLYDQPNRSPVSFIKYFKEHNLNERYELTSFLKPGYLEADFNGDGINDVFITITEKRTHKKGLLLIDGKDKTYTIFGAGTNFGNSSNYSWLKGWKLYKKRMAYESLFDNDGNMSGSRPIKLKFPGIFIYDVVDGAPYSGGLIYWDGYKYLWIHQGE